MRLEDHGSPEVLANCIVDHFQSLDIPVPIEQIAVAVGILSINGIASDNFEGLLVTDASKLHGSIAYNAGSPEERRRFTIAHELGHFLIPTHRENAQCGRAELGVVKSTDPRKVKEAEANRFAACLLMPRNDFLRAMRQLGAPETEHLLKLAARYRVSKEAAARRYTELCEDSCAVVFSHNGTVRSTCKSSEFPFLSVRNGDSMPRKSVSRRVGLSVGKMSSWADATPETWTERALSGKTLCEQFLQQSNGYGMTMLTVEADNDANDDDEDQVSHSWGLPTFRR